MERIGFVVSCGVMWILTSSVGMWTAAADVVTGDKVAMTCRTNDAGEVSGEVPLVRQSGTLSKELQSWYFGWGKLLGSKSEVWVMAVVGKPLSAYERRAGLVRVCILSFGKPAQEGRQQDVISLHSNTLCQVAVKNGAEIEIGRYETEDTSEWCKGRVVITG